jgi:hypothetical protein
LGGHGLILTGLEEARCEVRGREVSYILARELDIRVREFAAGQTFAPVFWTNRGRTTMAAFSFTSRDAGVQSVHTEGCWCSLRRAHRRCHRSSTFIRLCSPFQRFVRQSSSSGPSSLDSSPRHWIFIRFPPPLFSHPTLAS